MKKILFLILIISCPSIAFSKKEGKDLIDSILKVLPSAKDDTNKVMLLDKLTNAFGEDFANESIIYDLQELELAQKLGWTKGILLAYGHMGDDYSGIGDHQKEQEAYLNGLHAAQKANANLRELRFLMKLGYCYSELKAYDSSIACYERVILLCDKFGIKDGKFYPEIFTSNAFIRLHQYSKALASGFEAVNTIDSISKVPEFGFGIIGRAYFCAATDSTYNLISDNYLLPTREQNLKKAIYYLKLGCESHKTEDIELLFQVYSDLSAAYAMIGDFSSAFKVLKVSKETADSLYQKDKIRTAQVSALVAQLKGERIQQDFKELKLKEQAQLLLAVAFCLMLVTSLFIFRNYKTQKKYNALVDKEKRQALEKVNSQSDLLTEIAYTQSHDVRGPLSTIIGLADLYNHEKPDDPTNAELVQGIATTAKKLDEVVIAIVQKENNLKDR